MREKNNRKRSLFMKLNLLGNIFIMKGNYNMSKLKEIKNKVLSGELIGRD